jgi:hypothetical protein
MTREITVTDFVVCGKEKKLAGMKHESRAQTAFSAARVEVMSDHRWEISL